MDKHDLKILLWFILICISIIAQFIFICLNAKELFFIMIVVTAIAVCRIKYLLLVSPFEEDNDGQL